MRLNLANPLVVYIFVWSLTLLLVILQLTTNLLPLNESTLILIISNFFTFAVIYIIFSSQYTSKKHFLDKKALWPQLVLLRKYIKILLVLWIAGTVFEIIVSGGVPLQWALMHMEKNYTHFGVKSFHGFMNSLYLFSVTALFFDYLICKKRTVLLICMVLLLWPIIIIERGILLGAILQIFCIYSMVCGMKGVDVLKGGIFGFLILILFGMIGDIRTSVASPYINLIADEYREFFSNLPSGFLWVYVYVTSPLNNIIANIDSVVPNFVPFYSLIFFVPTAIRDLFCIDPQRLNSLNLVNSDLNVSTFYAGFIADFGMLGSIIVVAILQLVVTLFYLEARRFKLWALFGYSTLFQCIIFSIFFNLFFSWVYVFQIVLALLFNKVLKNANINK